MSGKRYNLFGNECTDPNWFYFVHIDEHNAEITRLRSSIKSAFQEGFRAAYCTALTDEECEREWDKSEVKKALGHSAPDERGG